MFKGEDEDEDATEDETSEEGTQPSKEKKTDKDEEPEEGSPAPKKEKSDEGEEEAEGSEDDADDKKGDEEPKVPLSRFRHVHQQLRELRAQIADRKQTPKSDMTEDEQKDLDAKEYLRKQLETILAEKEQSTARKDEQDAEELVELADIYGDFDVDKVLDIKAEFKKVGTSLSNEGALKIYFDREKNPGKRTSAEPEKKTSKPKVPQPKSGAPAKDEPTKPDVIGKPLSDVVAQAKKDFGLTK